MIPATKSRRPLPLMRAQRPVGVSNVCPYCVVACDVVHRSRLSAKMSGQRRDVLLPRCPLCLTWTVPAIGFATEMPLAQANRKSATRTITGQVAGHSRSIPFLFRRREHSAGEAVVGVAGGRSPISITLVSYSHLG